MLSRQYVMSLQLITTITAFTVLAVKFSIAVPQPLRPDCPTTCGNLTNIEFPFGTSPECSFDDDFLITCNTTTNKPFWGGINKTEVLNISLDGQMSVLFGVTRACFNEPALTDYSLSMLPKFSISSTRNRFMAVGCKAMLGLVMGFNNHTMIYATGCIANSENIKTVLVNGTCEGIGCCKSLLPNATEGIAINIQNVPENISRNVSDCNSCSYAFLVEEGAYNFSSLDLRDLQGKESMPLALDWSIGNNMSCIDAKKNMSSYACRSENSDCVDSKTRAAYNCNCTSGYEGNPYLINGCKDIDECKVPDACKDGYCKNTIGSHDCICPRGLEYDETIGSCRAKERAKERAKGPTLLQILFGTSSGLLVLLLGSTCTFWLLHKRKKMKQREEFFRQNGGFMLKQQLSKHQGSSQTAKIFSSEDLKKATNNYDEARVIGQGGFGTVYKGILPDNLEVAIKKSKVSDKSQIEQFINEVVILSQINHRNVVKLLGCCLETEVPLLVYEFIKNGTLSDHIHNEARKLSLSWKMRLKIAMEAAGALAYLHSETSTPIIHRDIKSTNILLDENYTTKVSDFGASRLIPLDQSQWATLVQGTLGYMDPEYFHSSQLTEKSDVYSFGVLLAELLTGEPAISFNKPEKERNLAMYFVSSVKENRLLEILDDKLVNEGNIDQLKEVAMLVKRCLSVKGEERPGMREVSIELEGLLRMMETNHKWARNESACEESESLLNDAVPSNGYDGSGIANGYDSMKDQLTLSLELR